MMVMMGVGLLMNTIQMFQSQGEMSGMKSQLEAQNASMMKSLKDNAGFGMVHKGAQVQSTMNWNFDAPPFPDKSYKNVQQMQMGALEERQAFTQKLQGEVLDMKNGFFADNHYQTQPGADGKPQVAVNAQGQPQVAQGAENADQKLARMQFENDQRGQLADKQTGEREHFLGSEKQKFTEFLGENRQQLGNPYVQGELQKMVVDTKKKSLQLQQDQEDERWKVDLPPVPQIGAHVDQGLQQLRQMDQEHIAKEESSPDMQALLEHDQKVAAIVSAQRDLAQQSKSDEDFLKDPRKMMAAAQTSSNQPRDPGEVLPGYLTHALYSMGIYQV